MSDNDWIDWAGGECPVPAEQAVDVEFADGVRIDNMGAGFWAGGSTPVDQNYWRAGSDALIVRYREVPA